MRLTFVTPKLNLSQGGSNFSLDLVAGSLAERGHDVSVVTIHPEENELPSDPAYDVVGPAKRRFGTRLGVQERVHRTMKARVDETDLFHVFAPFYLPAAGLFRQRDGTTPVVGRLNNYSMFCTNHNRMDRSCHSSCGVVDKFRHQDAGLTKRALKLPFYVSRTYAEPGLAASLDRYFAISPAVKRIYTDVGLPAEETVVVPNFYDPEFGTGSDRVVDSSNGFSVLYVGRLKRSKGVDVLLEALATTDGVDARIVGDGEAFESLRQQASELGLTGRVSFKGWVDNSDLPAYYRGADLFVHPGRWPEPFGRTLLESLHCETPALVSDIGGPSWVVGEAGETFPVERADRLAERLERLRDDADHLAELRSACRPRLDRFAPERVLDLMETEYRRVRG